jgi:tetratricopeptide (TPR) repeat protein/CHAT domain-containing protein
MSEQKDFVQRAEELINHGELQRAAHLLLTSIIDMPLRWRPFNDLPDRYEGFFWDEEEYVSFKKNSELSPGKDVSWCRPSYSKAYYLRTRIAVEQGDYRGALSLIERGLALEPDHPRLICEKALIRGHQNDLKDAKRLYQKALEVRAWSPDSVKALAYRGLGETMLALDELKEAEEALEKSLALHPNNEVADILDEARKLRPVEGVEDQGKSGIEILLDLMEKSPHRQGTIESEPGAGGARADIESDPMIVFSDGEMLRARGTEGTLIKALGRYADALRLFRAEQSSLMESVTLFRVGLTYAALGRPPEAFSNFEAALRLIRALDKPASEFEMLSEGGTALKRLGEYDGAVKYFERAIELYTVAGDPSVQAALFYETGETYEELGDEQKAVQCFERALAAAREMNLKGYEANALNKLSSHYYAQGQWPQAIDYFWQLLPFVEDMDDPYRKCVIYYYLGEAYQNSGEARRAVANFEQALAICRALRDRNVEAKMLSCIGAAYLLLGAPRQAITSAMQPSSLRRAAAGGIDSATELPGDVGAERENSALLEQAHDHIKQALKLYEMLGDMVGQAHSLLLLGQVHFLRHEFRESIDCYMKAYPTVQLSGEPLVEANTLAGLGQAHKSSGENQKALDFYQRAAKLYLSLDDADQAAMTLGRIALIHHDLGEEQEALNSFQRAASIFREAGNLSQEATVLNNIGRVYDSVGDKQKAIESFESAFIAERNLGNEHEAAIVMDNLITALSDDVESREGISRLEQLVDIPRTESNQRAMARALNLLGDLYRKAGELKRALGYCQEALSIRKEMGDRQGEADSLNMVGVILSEQGEEREALGYYEQALDLSHKVGDQQQEAAALSNLGALHRASGHKEQALRNFQRALALFQKVGDRGGEALALNSVGVIYREWGNMRRALSYFEAALVPGGEARDRHSKALTHYNLGELYTSWGEPGKAFEQFEASLSLSRGVSKNLESDVLNATGNLYSFLGEEQRALEHFNQALNIKRALGDRAGAATVLNNIGHLFNAAFGEYRVAISYFEQGLQLCREAGAANRIATLLLNMGVSYSHLGESDEARRYYEEALKVYREQGEREGEGQTLTNLGGTYRKLGKAGEALDSLKQALVLHRLTGNHDGEAGTFLELAMLERSQDRLKKARRHMSKALKVIDSLRIRINDPDMRATFSGSHSHYYEHYIDLLVQMSRKYPRTKYGAKYMAAAFQVSERSRARTLLEILAEARVDMSEGGDTELLRRERELQGLLSDKERERVQLLGNNPTLESVAALEEEVSELSGQIQQLRARIRAEHPRYAELTQPRPMGISDIRQLLDPDTLVLEFSTGKERSFLWVVSTDGLVNCYDLPAREDIEIAARWFYELLTARNIRREEDETEDSWLKRRSVAAKRADAELPDAALWLSRMLIAPAAADLGTKRLVIVAEGTLQFIPFAALPEPSTVAEEATGGGQPLVIKHEIVYLPSASTLAALRREARNRTPPTKNCAIFADPVYEHDNWMKGSVNGKPEQEAEYAARAPTTSASGPQTSDVFRAAAEVGFGDARRFERLWHSREEAKAIFAMTGGAGSLLALDFEASRATVLKTDLEQYRIVHFAAHGLFNSIHPERSGVVLSLFDERGTPQNGFLRLYDIYNLHLSADLVVLSACQTALGRIVLGEGLIGLTRGFMYAGAPRVVASLWEVNDEATGELIKLFYQGIQQRRRYAAALRDAQLKWLEQYAEGREKRSPYYWAAFTIQGEWR